MRLDALQLAEAGDDVDAAAIDVGRLHEDASGRPGARFQLVLAALRG